MPRPRKPTAVLKAQGTFNVTRHRGRNAEPQPQGKPRCPRWLTGDAKKLWQKLIPQLTDLGIATSLDSLELAALCRWFDEWRKADKRLQAARIAKVRYRSLLEAQMAWKQFDKIAQRFGMTPSDRSKLTTAEAPESEDPLLEMLKSRSTN